MDVGRVGAVTFSPRLDECFVAEPQAVLAARHAVDGLDGVLGPALCRQLSLLVSELVTNAVLHGSSRPTDPIAVRVLTSPEAVRVEVSDRGPGFEPPRSSSSRERRADGWGPFLVERIADRCGVHRGRGAGFWFELDRTGGPQAR